MYVWRALKTMKDQMFNMQNLRKPGSCPECHSGRRCCNGNCSWISDHTIWITYSWLPLWDHLYLWLPSGDGKCCKKITIDSSAKYKMALKCSVLHIAVPWKTTKDPGYLRNTQSTCCTRCPWRSCRCHYSCYCPRVCVFIWRVGVI